MIDIPDEKLINFSRDDSDTPDTTYYIIDERGPLVSTSFTSYSEFVRWYNKKEPHLYDQREILAAIVFEEGATKLPTLVNPKEFDYRGPSDWQENPGGYERIAVVAFDYWEDHGKPPAHDIADLMEGDEQALNYLYDLETVWARAIDLEARAKWKPGDPIVNTEFTMDELATFWINRLVRSVEDYREEVEAARRRREQNGSSKPLPRSDMTKALAKDGKTQKEIAQELGISQAAVSKRLRRSSKKRWRSGVR